MSYSQVEIQALRLDELERARLAHRLLDSLVTSSVPSASIEAAWAAEAERRCEAIETGELSGRPAAEAIAEARRLLK